MSPHVAVGVVQTDPLLGDLERNLQRVERGIRETPTRLVVFPECALTGYGFSDVEEARRVAVEIPGKAIERLIGACREQDRFAVVGTLERADGKLYNSAVLMGPDGLLGVYRKMHLPFLGIDRFTEPGDLGFPVFSTPIGRIGILICFDLSFPEAVRVLKLGGAQIVCVPTNWPEAAEVSCLHAPPVRAQENHVHVITADRVGHESGFRFRGGSQICDLNGRTLARAGWEEETIVAELDPNLADENRVVIVPGAYEIDRIAGRRPSQYGRIVE